MTSGLFQLQDLYTAGIGFDLGGAFLLARGLINPPAELTRLGSSFYGSNRFQAISLARNRLDAVAGVSGLFAGFILQAIGYIEVLSVAHRTATGTDEALVAAAFALLALATVMLVGNVYRQKRLIPLLVEMARWTLDDERMAYPSASLLPHWVEALESRREGENDLDLVRRIAGVENLIVNVNARPGINETRRRLWTDPPLEGEQ